MIKMPTKVAFRVLYIELIICGYLAWVLVARNLCLSETGAPISCPVSRHGNATGKGTSDGETSGTKVKGQSEGEVVNMGGRRRNIKIEKRFKPLFIVSKDRSRPKAPGTSVTDDRKARMQTEKKMLGKNVMDPEWSVEGPVDEKNEVMQSRDQLPNTPGVYEFLDMFQVSDWLSEKRRQKSEAARRAGSEERDVDSKTEWYASKVEQDDEAEDSFKMKRQHADSKDEDVNSEEEVFRSIITKAKPVRIKATIVAKTILPRAKLFGSKYKALAANAEDVTSTAEAVISKEKLVVDPKAQSIVPPTLTVSGFISLSGTSLNRTNASSLVLKEINPDSKDLPSSKTPASSLDKEQSNSLGFSDDNSGFIAKILSTIFRGDDTIETPEEFDEEDVLEAAKSDAEDEVSYEMMDKLAESKDSSKGVNEEKEDAKRSTEIEHSTEENETLATVAAKDRFEEAENSTEIAENQFGGEEGTSAEVKSVSIAPSESTNASEDSANVSAHGSLSLEGESIVVSLIQGRNILGAKDSGPPNEKDASNSPRNDPHNVANEKEEVLSAIEKEIHEKAQEMSSKSKDDIPLKTKDFQLKATDILVKAKNLMENPKDVPVKAKIIPVKGKIISVNDKDFPLKGNYIPLKVKDVHADTKAIDVKADDITAQSTDSPREAQITTENIRNIVKVVPVNINEILALKAEDIPAGVDETTATANEMPSTAEGISMEQEDVSNKVTDRPTTAEGIPIKLEKLSKKANDMPAKAEGIPRKQEDLSKKANDMPAKADGIPGKQEDLSTKPNDMSEHKAEGIPRKQVDLPKNPNDMPAKGEGISMKLEKLSKKANDMPVEAEGIPRNEEDLSKKASDMPAKAEGIPMNLEKLSKTAKNDMPAKAEGIPRKQEDLSKKPNDMPAEADVKYEPSPKQMQDAPTKLANASVNANDTKGEDQKSIMDREEVKIAMFTEMGNIMSDLDYLGTLWEQLKPGMKLKNSDAVRKVLHAVADVFGLENKDDAESSGKSEPGKTAAEKLRYDVAVQRTKDDEAQMEFKDVSSRDAPGGQEPRVGLRSKRSLDGVSRRRRVQATDRGQRTRRNRNWLDRKYKRLAADVLSKQDGQENEDEDEDEEIVVEEDVSKKKRDDSRVRKRMGDNEDYIFGSNPGFILSRERRDAPPDNSTVETVADKAEEDAISRELANLLIEKVYNRVMKSLKTPKQPETEVAQTTGKPSEMYEDEESERRKRKSDGNLRRSKRFAEDIDVGSYCKMLKTHPMKVPDESGQKTDLYTQAVNAGICLDFEMARVAEHEVAKRESPTLAEDNVETDERDEEMEEVERGTAVEVEGKTKRQASEEANGEVRNEVGKVIQREAEGETQELAQGEDKREVNNDAKRVIQREAEGETQELAQGEDKREDNNEAERVILREARGENQELAKEEANREVKNEAERVIQREAKGETQRLAEGEDKRDVKNEAEGVIQREAKGETQRLFQGEDNREVNNEVERSIDRKFRMQVYGETQEQAKNEAKSEKEAENEVRNEKMDAKKKEESEMEQMVRETRYEDPNSAADNIVQFGNDKWDFAKDEFRGDFDEEKRSAEENISQKAKQDLKGRRRSMAKDKNERELDDFMNYMNLKSGEADDKDFEGQ